MDWRAGYWPPVSKPTGYRFSRTDAALARQPDAADVSLTSSKLTFLAGDNRHYPPGQRNHPPEKHNRPLSASLRTRVRTDSPERKRELLPSGSVRPGSGQKKRRQDGHLAKFNAHRPQAARTARTNRRLCFCQFCCFAVFRGRSALESPIRSAVGQLIGRSIYWPGDFLASQKLAN
jgi:hypothetical protein